VYEGAAPDAFAGPRETPTAAQADALRETVSVLDETAERIREAFGGAPPGSVAALLAAIAAARNVAQAASAAHEAAVTKAKLGESAHGSDASHGVMQVTSLEDEEGEAAEEREEDGAEHAAAPAAGKGFRRRRCGACAACLAENCGECSACRSMVCFGGSGASRQACVRRRCVAMSAFGHAAAPCPPPAEPALSA